MKVSVNQAQLAHGLSIVSRAVSPRSTLPVLVTRNTDSRVRSSNGSTARRRARA